MAQDVYTRLNDLDEPTVRSIADILELRGRHPQQASIRRAYLDTLGDLTGLQVLEVGCGTGVVARDIAERLGPAGHVTGVDPTRVLIETADRLRTERPLENASFAVEDGRQLSFADCSFDLTVAVTVLCHVPERADVLREMIRVTRPGGTILIVDGEYAANQIQHPDPDATRRVIAGWHKSAIDDPNLMRRIVPLVQAAGLRVERTDGYVHVEAGQVDKETSFIWQWGQYAVRQALAVGTVDDVTAQRWTEQLRELNERSELYGAVTYVGVVARKPA